MVKKGSIIIRSEKHVSNGYMGYISYLESIWARINFMLVYSVEHGFHSKSCHFLRRILLIALWKTLLLAFHISGKQIRPFRL